VRGLGGQGPAAWLALACGLGCALGCDRQPAPAVAAAPLLQVVRGTLEDRFVLTGELEAVSSESLVVPRTPQWSASIRWLAADGTQVKKGDRVVELDASSFVSALDDKRLAVVRAQGELASESSRASATLADKEMDVSRKRAELDKAMVEVSVPPDLYPRRLYQEKQVAVDRSKDALAKAEEDLAAQRRAAHLERRVKALGLARAERELHELRQRLQEMVLRAPRDGLVQIDLNPREGRKYQVGDQVHPGWRVATMPELGAMQVKARLPDVDDRAVREGMPADCVLDAYPDRIWKGTVRAVSPIARAQGRESIRRFFDVLVALDRTATDVMRPGMSVRIEVVRRRARDVLLVPRMALRRPSAGEAPVAAPERVEIDWCTELTCVVRSGVSEGARLLPWSLASRGPS
jgi:HlyD family secretion protein